MFAQGMHINLKNTRVHKAMGLIKLLAVILYFLNDVYSTGAVYIPLSPCTDIFSYHNYGGSLYGILKIGYNTNTNVNLELTLSNRALVQPVSKNL